MRDELNSSPRESFLLEKLRCVPRKHFKWAEGKARKRRKKRIQGKNEKKCTREAGFRLRQSRPADNRC